MKLSSYRISIRPIRHTRLKPSILIFLKLYNGSLIMNKLLIALTLSISLSACASSHYGAAKITSIPTGAEVISDQGTILGVTPTTAWWTDESGKQQDLLLRFRKDGYLEKVGSFGLSMHHKSQQDAIQNPQKIEVLLDRAK